VKRKSGPNRRLAEISLAIVLLGGCNGSRPANLGVRDRTLARCPWTPNCASTQQESFGIEPIRYEGSRREAQDRLIEVFGSMSGGRVPTVAPDYVRAEFKSSVLRFVDDVEAYFDPAESVIHLRSASRNGFYDFGWNRWRIEEIRRRMGSGPR
jgi:uncharacterized protein (DUF1499 family)